MAATEEDNHLFLREQCSFMTGQGRQPTLKIWKQLHEKSLWVRVQHTCQASEEQTPPHSSPWPKTTKQMPLTHAENQTVSGWSEGKSLLHSTMEIKFQFFITAIPTLSSLNLISLYLPTPCSSSAQKGVSWDKLRQRPWRDTCSGNAKSTGMPTPPKESLKVCKAASLSSCSTRMQAAQETQHCAHAQAAFGL